MIQQLIEKIKTTKAPICVGLDPMLSYIPEHILKKSFGEYGDPELTAILAAIASEGGADALSLL